MGRMTTKTHVGGLTGGIPHRSRGAPHRHIAPLLVAHHTHALQVLRHRYQRSGVLRP